MTEEDRAEVELAIRTHFARREFREAMERAVIAYGPEILGFIRSSLRGEPEAHEAFSMFLEDAYRGLPQFAWQCTARAWLFTLARNAAHRCRRGEQRYQRRRVNLSEASSVLYSLEQRVRSATHPFLRTEAKAKFARIRSKLSDEENELLILRIDRKLAWDELARVLLGEKSTALTDAEVKAEAVRLRKQFQRLKTKLVVLGRREGLIAGEDA